MDSTQAGRRQVGARQRSIALVLWRSRTRCRNSASAALLPRQSLAASSGGMGWIGHPKMLTMQLFRERQTFQMLLGT